MDYRVRLRFRLNPIDSQDCEIPIDLDGQSIRFSGQDSAKPICENTWFVMNATGFADEANARAFGDRLKSCCDVASAIVRLGIDTGCNKATLQFSDQIKQATGYRDNIHGLDVFPNHEQFRFVFLQATGSVRMIAGQFLAALKEVGASGIQLSQRSQDAILLLNNALLKQDPVSKIVFCISAVEGLGQDEEWTHSQEDLIGKLASQALDEPQLDVEEAKEVSDAIRRGLHKISLRQGVIRLLRQTGLMHLKKAWDDLYGKRSTLVHGLAPRPGARYEELAGEAVNLCGHILLKIVAKDLPWVAAYADKYYSVP